MKKNKKMNPAEAFGKMRDAKKGIAVGSYLEGGTIKYKNNGPGDPPKKSVSSALVSGLAAGGNSKNKAAITAAGLAGLAAGIVGANPKNKAAIKAAQITGLAAGNSASKTKKKKKN